MVYLKSRIVLRAFYLFDMWYNNLFTNTLWFLLWQDAEYQYQYVDSSV